MFSQPLEVRCDSVPCWLMKQEEVTQPLQGEALAASGNFQVGVIFLPGNCAREGLRPSLPPSTQSSTLRKDSKDPVPDLLFLNH